MTMFSAQSVFTLACATSGFVWGLIATGVVRSTGNPNAGWQVVALSVIIGVVIGYLSVWFYFQRSWILIPWSIGSLYTAAALLAALGTVWLIAAPGQVPVQPPRGPATLVAEGILYALRVLTFGMHLLYLWPLSLINHALLRRLLLRINKQ